MVLHATFCFSLSFKFNQDWRSNDFPPNATFGKTGSQELGATDGRDYN